jgi:uncharacterized OB-fold protein
MIGKLRQTALLPAARCSGCGRVYDPVYASFLYSDELGSRCRECGSILIEAAQPVEANTAEGYLTIAGSLEKMVGKRRLHTIAGGK